MFQTASFRPRYVEPKPVLYNLEKSPNSVDPLVFMTVERPQSRSGHVVGGAHQHHPQATSHFHFRKVPGPGLPSGPVRNKKVDVSFKEKAGEEERLNGPRLGVISVYDSKPWRSAGAVYGVDNNKLVREHPGMEEVIPSTYLDAVRVLDESTESSVLFEKKRRLLDSKLKKSAEEDSKLKLLVRKILKEYRKMLRLKPGQKKSAS